ncbi:MAG: PQQ-binding-like beta-propeller repeat protein [Candidatus Thermoplasmatota archaeon]|nr:PQQ-binding-like beta-propeller repeat protein [Candidatus Thermoplasmatota archaeon]
MNKINGNLSWSFTPGYFVTDDNPNNYITTPILSNPIVNDGVVYFSAKGNVYALDAQTYEVVESTSNGRVDVHYNSILLLLILIIVAILLVFLYTRIKKRKEDGGKK